jgi:hypothetical protein
MLQTFQGSYILLAEATQDISGFDGTSPGLTSHWHDLPADRPAGESPNIRDATQGTVMLGPEANGCVIIAACVSTATEDKNGNFELWGWPELGPAEYIADISCTTGLNYINDISTALYVDTMTIAEQFHVKNLTAKDSGNNRICKLQFDLAGIKYLSCRWYDITGRWESYIRFY